MTVTRRHILTLAAPVLAAVLMASPAQAKPGHVYQGADYHAGHTAPAYSQTYAPRIVNPAPLWVQAKISAGQAKSIARKRHKGAKFVDISRRGNVYVVRLIKKDGRVVDVFVDAMTGRIR